MRIAIAYFVGLTSLTVLLLIYHAMAQGFPSTTTLWILAITTIVVGIFLLAATIYFVDEGRE